jgi:hypothetical protein
MTPGFSYNINSNSASALAATQGTLAPNQEKLPIKSILPKMADINFSSKLELLKQDSNYVSIMSNIENQINIAVLYYNILQSGDPVTDFAEFYSGLNNKLFDYLDSDFIEFWSKRYDSAIEPVKTLVEKQINTKKNYYKNISDSIGLLVNSDNKIDDSTTPVYDLTCGIYGAPNYIPIQLRNKVSPITKQVITDLSTKTSSLMRVNLQNIYFVSPNDDPYQDSTRPHGTNLIADYNYYVNYTSALKTFYLSLVGYYSKFFEYVRYHNNIGNFTGCNLRDSKTNVQKMSNAAFQLKVENGKPYVDLLLNEIFPARKSKTIKDSISAPLTQNNAYTNTATNQTNLVPNITEMSFALPINKLPDAQKALTSNLSTLNINPADYLKSININKYAPDFLFGNLTNIIPPGLSNLNIPNFMEFAQIPNFITSINPTQISSLTNLASLGNLIPGGVFGSSLGTIAGDFSKVVGAASQLANSLGGVANLFNGGFKTDPMSVYNSLQSVKDIICNFSIPDLNSSLNFDFNFDINFDEIERKLLNLFPKLDISLSSFGEIFDQLSSGILDNIEKTFTDLYKNLTSCG